MANARYPRDNMDATTDPVVSDDESLFYGPFSRWYNTTTKSLWYCVDASSGAAVWTNVASVPVYHPDDDGLGADMYVLADAGDITEVGTGVDRWDWRNTTGVLAGHNYKQGTDSNRPSYNASGVLAKPCVTFNGTSDFMRGRDNGDTADLPMSTFLDTNAVGCILAVFATSAVASTSSTPYNNDTILGDDSGGTGCIVLHNNTTDYDFRTWAYTGATPYADAKFSLNEGVVGMYRKTSTTLYSSVNGGTESSIAAATVSTLTYGVQIGDAIGEEFGGEIYCIMAWKTTPSNIADIITNLKTFFGIS